MAIIGIPIQRNREFVGAPCGPWSRALRSWSMAAGLVDLLHSGAAIMRLQGAMAMAIGVIGLNGLESGEKVDRIYEMRTYYAAPGKLDDLQARFRDHTVKL